MYSFESRVRYSEIDKNKRLTIPGVINYFQDCSTFHSEYLGLGVEWLREHHFCWVLSSWEIKVHRLPELGENIVVSTMPYEMKGFFGFRNFAISVDGINIVEANSVWTYIDTEKMRPVKVDEISLTRYQLDTPLEGNWKGRKITVPDESEKKTPIEVAKFLLDTNGHVNNAKYILLAMEYVPDEFQVDYIRVEYKRSAVLGDIMIPAVTINQKQIVVSMENENGDPFAVIEFERGNIC